MQMSTGPISARMFKRHLIAATLRGCTVFVESNAHVGTRSPQFVGIAPDGLVFRQRVRSFFAEQQSFAIAIRGSTIETLPYALAYRLRPKLRK
jgi:hypothetical protein